MYVYKRLSAQSGKFFSCVYSAFIVVNIPNIIACPFAILPNILVTVAIKTKRQLGSRLNVSLACLATPLFPVGLIFSTYGYQSKK